MTSTQVVPETGVDYPVTLGETFRKTSGGQRLCTLRYDFKPASAGRFQPGKIEIAQDQSRVCQAMQLACQSIANRRRQGAPLFHVL